MITLRGVTHQLTVRLMPLALTLAVASQVFGAQDVFNYSAPSDGTACANCTSSNEPAYNPPYQTSGDPHYLPACGLDQEVCAPCQPFFYFRAEGIALRRSVLSGGTSAGASFGPVDVTSTITQPSVPPQAVTSNTTTSGTTVTTSETTTITSAISATAQQYANASFSSDSFSQPFQAGPKITLGHAFAGTPYAIEFSYLWLTNQDESTAGAGSDINQSFITTTTTATTTATTVTTITPNSGNPTTNDPGVTVGPTTTATSTNALAPYHFRIHEASYMDTGELNLRYMLPTETDNFYATFLIGLRHLTLREEMDGIWTSDSGSFAFEADSHTSNDLWGAQIGGAFELYCQRKFWLDVDVKGALCNNHMVVNAMNSMGPGTQAVQNATAGIVDVDLAAVYRPSSHFSARIGYQALWMTGMAFAAGNCNSDGNIQQGTALYHGPHAGIELDW